ncbi:MAG: hypothetical protein Q8L34_03675 [Candidatus Woesearchaeota archaeon]|nr:hypothetical protein [Candidatus Woesearchaeota archaeon]
MYLLKEYGQPHLLVLPHVQDAFKRGQSTSVRNLERRYRSAAGRDLRADLDRIMLGDKRTGTLTRIVNIFMHDGIVELHRTWFGAQKITEGRIYRKIRVFDSSVMQSVDEEAQKEYRIDPATRVR